MVRASARARARARTRQAGRKVHAGLEKRPPPARSGHSACIIGDEMIIYGGDDGEGRSLHDVWSYHIIKGVWAKLHVVVSTVGARGREG